MDERTGKLEEALGGLRGQAVMIVVTGSAIPTAVVPAVSTGASTALVTRASPQAEQFTAAESIDGSGTRGSDASFGGQADPAPRRRWARLRKWRPWLFYGGGSAIAAGLMVPEALAAGGTAAVLAGMGGVVVSVVGADAMSRASSQGSERL